MNAHFYDLRLAACFSSQGNVLAFNTQTAGTSVSVCVGCNLVFVSDTRMHENLMKRRKKEEADEEKYGKEKKDNGDKT
jgi:hypothetical protein